MIIAVFDVDTGQCLQIRDTAYGNLSDYPLAKELTEAVDPSSIWYNKTSNTVVTRTEVSLDLPDIVSVGDTVQAAIPADCYAEVNNVKQTNNIVIDTSKPDSFWVQLIGPSKFEKKVNVFSYFQKRKKQYPSIVDQLDELYHNGIDGWKAKIKEVKDKYPKS
tara:strand:- start:190 stop:675 length:486 start_codon:yes stop_codon:yes gene_type:complete